MTDRCAVLIVEKDPLQGYLLKVSLQEADWMVCLVHEPDEALLFCEHNLYDAAIINGHYPGKMNGFVLGNQLFDQYHLPSLMITASRIKDLRRSIDFNPAQDLLYKPYLLSECGPRLRRLITGRPLLFEQRLAAGR